jgi:8-oxo-dGTP diphosphatase
MAIPPEPSCVPDRLVWPRAGASIAVVREESVLLVERGKPPLAGVWSLPGGHIEPGETAAAAALRELREETGICADLAGLIDISDVIQHDRLGRLEAHYLLAVYWARWQSGRPAAASDARRARFVPVRALDSYPLTPRTRTFAQRALVMAGAG